MEVGTWQGRVECPYQVILWVAEGLLNTSVFLLAGALEQVEKTWVEGITWKSFSEVAIWEWLWGAWFYPWFWGGRNYSYRVP